MIFPFTLLLFVTSEFLPLLILSCAGIGKFGLENS